MESEDIYNSIGIPIKRAAASYKMTVKDFARKKLFINPSYLSQVMHGHRKPSLILVNRLIEMGFDPRIFQVYDNKEYNLQNITVHELVTLLKEQRRLLEDQSEKIKGLSKVLQDCHRELKKFKLGKAKFTTE